MENIKYSKLKKKIKQLALSFTVGLVVCCSGSGYYLCTHLYNLHIFKSILWAIPTAFLLRLIRGITDNKKLLITTISLLDDGKKVEIETVSGKYILPIGEMRLPTEEETGTIHRLLPNVNQNYYVVIIGQSNYLIPKEAGNRDREILNAIINGKYIDLTDGDKKIDKEKAIDI